MKNTSFFSRFCSASCAVFLLGVSQGLGASLSLADALDTTNVTWTTTDTHPWMAQTNVSHDGLDAAQLQVDETGGYYSTLEATVTGPSRIRFWWKSAGQWRQPQVALYLGADLLATNGVAGWTQAVVILPPGRMTLRWVFGGSYDYEAAVGDMAWVDEVTVEPIDDTTGPALVTGQPRNTTAAVGTTVFFNAFVGGSRPLHLQWFFEGNPIASATNVFLSLRNVQLVQAGRYSLQVTNALGTTVSSNAVLTVNATDALTEALDDPTLNWRSDGWMAEFSDTHDGLDAASAHISFSGVATLETTVLGPGSISFWWKTETRDEDGSYLSFSISGGSGAGITGYSDWEHHSLLVPPGVQTLRWVCSSGSDQVGAAGWLDQVRFDPNGPYAPTLAQAPQPQPAAQGDDVLLRVEVAGTEPFAYQWRYNGQSLPGANNAILMLTNIEPNQAGSYSVSVSNMVGGLVTTPVAVTVGPPLAHWAWARQLSSPNFDAGECVAVDPAGSVYVGGSYRTNALVGSVLLTNAGGDDIFLAKYDAAGNLSWVRRFGGPGYDRLDTIALDASGNLFLCGPFTGTLSLDSTNLVATGNRDLFLAKCDAEGHFLWARRMTNSPTNFDLRTCLAVNSGAIYLAGVFQGTTTLGAYTLTTTGYRDIFLAKYDGAGNVLWAKSAGTTANNEASPFSLVADNVGNAYVSGFFEGTLNFGPTNLTSWGYDTFLAKYDAQGNVAWAKQAEPTQSYYAPLAVDPAGNLLVHDSSLAKFSPSGQVLWTRALPAYGGHLLDRHPQVDAAGNIYLAGQLEGLFELENHCLFSHYDNETFVGKLDPDGHVVWLKKADTHSAVVNDVAVSAAGEVYLTGYFSTYTFSDHGGTNYFGTNTLVSAGEYDVFLAKLSPQSRPHLNVQVHAGTPGIQFQLNSPMGRIYCIETSTDFHTWTHLVTVTNATGEVRFTDTEPSPPTKRFYRAREQ